MSGHYEGLPKHQRVGCIAAFIIGAPVFLLLLGLDALGDCAPDTACQKGFFLMVLLPTIAITGAAFWLADRLARRGSG